MAGVADCKISPVKAVLYTRPPACASSVSLIGLPVGSVCGKSKPP